MSCQHQQSRSKQLETPSREEIRSIFMGRGTFLVSILVVGTLVHGTPANAGGPWLRPKPCRTCPPVPCPPVVIEAVPPTSPMDRTTEPNTSVEPTTPEADSQATPPSDSPTNLFDNLDSSMTTAFNSPQGSAFSAPNMIGDQVGEDNLTGNFPSNNQEFPDQIVVVDPALQRRVAQVSLDQSPGTGGGVGRIKLAENTSILPVDRVYFSYEAFGQVPISPGGTFVNRFTPGFEKTFFNGMTSVEVRIPFAGTIDSNQELSALGANDVVLGNVTLFLKALLYADETFAAGMGLTVTTPTAPDLVVTSFREEAIRITNEGSHLAPYLGVIWMPGRFFAQVYFQYDMDATGRPVRLSSTRGMINAGRFNDTTVAFLDTSFGYWVYRTNDTSSFLSGVAPVFEAHYNGAIGNGDRVASDEVAIFDSNDNYQVLNCLVGSHFVFRQRNILTLAVGFPVTGTDRQFDYEFKVYLNHLFGQVRSYNQTPIL